MILGKYFQALERSLFGPWLAKYKNFFSNEELEKEKSSVQTTLNETDEDVKIVITSNNVIKVDKEGELPEKTIDVVNDHIIQEVFTKITNTQLKKFFEFITHLPSNFDEYEEYFAQEESKDGYSKIEAFKEVPEYNGYPKTGLIK